MLAATIVSLGTVLVVGIAAVVGIVVGVAGVLFALAEDHRRPWEGTRPAGMERAPSGREQEGD